MVAHQLTQAERIELILRDWTIEPETPLRRRLYAHLCDQLRAEQETCPHPASRQFVAMDKPLDGWPVLLFAACNDCGKVLVGGDTP